MKEELIRAYIDANDLVYTNEHTSYVIRYIEKNEYGEYVVKCLVNDHYKEKVVIDPLDLMAFIYKQNKVIC